MKVKVLVAQSCPILCNSMDCRAHWLLSPWNSPGKNTGVSSPSLLQGSSWPRDQTRVFCIAGRFFTVWATRREQRPNLPNFWQICFLYFFWFLPKNSVFSTPCEWRESLTTKQFFLLSLSAWVLYSIITFSLMQLKKLKTDLEYIHFQQHETQSNL